MMARTAFELAEEAARAEAMLDTWPVTPQAVGTAQAVLGALRIALGVEAASLVTEEIQVFGEPL